MVRHLFIEHRVLQIYREFEEIQFPLDVKQVIKQIPNCRYMSYQDFAKLNNCSINDAIQFCESKSGCTHYDFATDRYLILCNQSTDDNNNPGRQRWTLAHEIGHIVCNHHTHLAFEKSAQSNFYTFEKFSENNLLRQCSPEYEGEADYFAATLLAPFPILKYLGVQSPADIQTLCGLSSAASVYRFNEYVKWCTSHRKTAWENDMVSIFRAKGTVGM